MKKLIAISMIALLAVSTVFAGFSGSVSTEAGWWIDAEEAGFKNGNGKFTLTFDGNTLNGGSKADADVYAEIAATASVSTGKVEGANGTEDAVASTAKLTLDKFAVVGKDWSVDLTGAAGIGNLAADWKANDDGKTANLVNGVDLESRGVTVDVLGYKAGLGFWTDKTGTSAALTLATPSYTLAEGLTLSAAAGTGKKASAGTVDLGAGAKVAYAQEGGLSASVATDLVLDIPTSDANKLAFDADVAVAVAYAPVTFNAYYATEANGGYLTAAAEHYYTLGLTADLSSVKVPLTLGLEVLNIKKANGEIIATVGSEFSGVTLGANGGYNFGTEKWNAGLDASYKIEKIGSVAGGVAVKENAKVLNANLGFTTTDLLANATLGLKWESGNLLADKAEFGSIVASIACKF